MSKEFKITVAAILIVFSGLLLGASYAKAEIISGGIIGQSSTQFSACHNGGTCENPIDHDRPSRTIGALSRYIAPEDTTLESVWIRYSGTSWSTQNATTTLYIDSVAVAEYAAVLSGTVVVDFTSGWAAVNETVTAGDEIWIELTADGAQVNASFHSMVQFSDGAGGGGGTVTVDTTNLEFLGIIFVFIFMLSFTVWFFRPTQKI